MLPNNIAESRNDSCFNVPIKTFLRRIKMFFLMLIIPPRAQLVSQQSSEKMFLSCTHQVDECKLQRRNLMRYKLFKNVIIRATATQNPFFINVCDKYG